MRGSAERQRALLAQAADLVRPGGVLVYSTCTFAPEENEQQVAAFLDGHQGWELLEIPARHGFAPGRPDWSPGGSSELARTVRLWPHRLRGEGHFIAKLGRRGGTPASPGERRAATRPSRGRAHDSSAVLATWKAFASDTLLDPPTQEPRAVGDRAYLIPDERLVPSDLRWFRPGLQLGRSRRGRFEPAQALAMASDPSSVRRLARLTHVEARAYLHGEALDSAGPAGWTLVTTEGWSLGWGKASGGTLKNHYPKRLRLMTAGPPPAEPG